MNSYVDFLFNTLKNIDFLFNNLKSLVLSFFFVDFLFNIEEEDKGNQEKNW